MTYWEEQAAANPGDSGHAYEVWSAGTASDDWRNEFDSRRAFCEGYEAGYRVAMASAAVRFVEIGETSISHIDACSMARRSADAAKAVSRAVIAKASPSRLASGSEGG